MRLVDANVLLYAVNADTTHHEVSRQWLDHALGGADTVGLTWLVVTAFVRLSSKIGLFPQPLSTGEAIAQVQAWIDAPGGTVVEPTAHHLSVLGRVLEPVGSGGNLVSDAHLAAIALEHRAEVVTFDADFGRFPGVRWRRPDELTVA